MRLLHVRTTTAPRRVIPNSTYHAFELSLWVDEAGVVHRAAWRSNRTVRGRSWQQDTVVRLTAIGTADAIPPTWLDRTANVTASAENGLLVVEHRGGPAVPFAGYTPVVGDDDGHRTAPLDGSLSPGDTVFVYYSRDDGGFTATRERPTTEQYVPQSGRISFAAGNETVGVRVAAEA